MSFRWKRGLLHALIPFGLVIVAGGILTVVLDAADPEKAGEGIGRFAFFALLAGLGVSYLAQTGRRKLAAGVSVGLVALIGGLVVALLSAAHHHSKLTAADRAALVPVDIAGEHRLRHPTLGFSIAAPPAGYVESPAMAAMMGASGDANSVFYAYAEPTPQAGLVIGVLYDAGDSPKDFRSVLAGLRRGLEKSAGTALEVLEEDLTGDVGRLHVTFSGIHVRLVAHRIHPAGRAPTIVTVMVMSAEPTLMAPVLASFRA